MTETTQSPTEFVTMRHDDVEGTAKVSRRALERVHAKRGWVEVPAEELIDEPQAVAPGPTPPPPPLPGTSSGNIAPPSPSSLSLSSGTLSPAKEG